MGRRGPLPKSTEQRIRDGNPSHRPLPDTILVAGRPSEVDWTEAPASLPKEGAEFWRAVTPPLVKAGILDLIDAPMLELACVQWARIQQARRVLAVDGLFGVGSTGQIKEHPALKIEREATNLFGKLAREIGIGPAARTALGLASLHGAALWQALEANIGDGSDYIDGTAASMTGAEVGLPGM